MARLTALSADSMEGRGTGTPGAARARRWIVRELEAMGVRPLGASYEHPVAWRRRGSGDSAVAVNLVARIPGREPGGPVLVLSAHVDHLGIRNGEVFNGADDDASGCVALLEVADALRRTPPRHDVLLTFFDAEEAGLQGARGFVAQPPLPLARIALVINADMVARQDGGALWVAGTAHTPVLKPLVEAVARHATIPVRLGHDTPGGKPGDDWTSSSDHGAFHARGVPFLYLGVEDHADYHRPGDDAAKVDPQFFGAVAGVLQELVRAADAALPSLPPHRQPAR
ncbi:MAG: M20/M25/M40 family metallo-hydrolase [Gemmatimonadetes bacterium]|nr:M20/M25/M40 family metallo-hydrolase [Gemmatimonadota bacterium]